MLAIAQCESGVRQFEKSGDVLRGRINRKDVGIFQINEKYHLEKSQTLGYDIYSVAGNIQYAIYLLKFYGTQPWSASASCWANLDNLVYKGLLEG